MIYHWIADGILIISFSLNWKFICDKFYIVFLPPPGLQDLSSLTRDQTRAHGSESAES